MRIVSFFKKPLPDSLLNGLKDIAEIQYWQDLSEKERSELDDVEIVISNPPVSMQQELLSSFPNLKMMDFMNGFEKDNENPYRLYRVVSVKKIDRWFFEKHNHRRTHAKIYETVIRPKFGMCENTFLDYRHESDELLELFPQSASVEFSLWLPTVQTKYMVPAEANRFSLMLWDSIDKAFRCIRRREPGCCIDADKLLTYMTLYLEERSSVGMK